jgi:endonuclease-3
MASTPASGGPSTTRNRATGRRRRPLARAAKIAERLAEDYPGTATELCALVHHDAFELLVATILSAQCTDERVNLVMPSLFARYRTPQDLAGADRAELENLIRSTGFFRAKASHILGVSEAIVMRHSGEVPRTMEELTALPGVGRKTANVVLSVAFGLPGLPVDTHVIRLSQRLQLTDSGDPVKIEQDLCALFAPSDWGAISLRLILHGRRVCIARRPRCEICEIADLCPSRRKF